MREERIAVVAYPDQKIEFVEYTCNCSHRPTAEALMVAKPGVATL
jgi:hypothetical protein